MKKLTLLLVIAVLLAILMALGAAQTALATTTCTFTTSGTTMTLNGDCTTDETILIPDGYTLDGAGYTITAEDPSSGHFLGAVVKNEGSTAHVTNLTVTAFGLANVCDAGADRLRGILFDGASGTITNNTVTDINQGASGCQEGNAIEVRNPPFTRGHSNPVKVYILNNEVAQYQKTGIVTNGDVAAWIDGNSVEGLGPVDYIAQNGIQVGFGASAVVTNNSVHDNFYSGDDWVSAGILVYQASALIPPGSNTFSGNQIDILRGPVCGQCLAP